MELYDWLGPGLCHQSEWRSMESAWLCDRCTGIYLGGFLGVALASLLARRLSFKWQLIVFLLSLLPMAVDGVTQLLLLRESTWPLRVITGSLVGVASVWLLYPHLEKAFAEIRQQVSTRLAAHDRRP